MQLESFFGFSPIRADSADANGAEQVDGLAEDPVVDVVGLPSMDDAQHPTTSFAIQLLLAVMSAVV